MLGDVTASTATAFGPAPVLVHPDVAEMARVAAQQAAAALCAAVQTHGVAHAMFATGNSQLGFVDALVRRTPDVPWQDVVVFHMDEYVGIGADHPASFQRWIRERIVAPAAPRAVHYVEGLGEPAAVSAHYAELLAHHPLDLCCLGIGENGHLAFNDPGAADFDDPLDVKVVELEAACRRQQVNEGHFPDVASVPSHAITVTIPALLRAAHVMAIVPEARKAEPVHAALTGPVSTLCPASVLRTMPHVTIHLDEASARLLPR
jgi:glucosamine-6-phosphate deaminase